MTKDSKDTGKTSTTKHSPRPPRPPPTEIPYADASHPIFSGQIEIGFGDRSRTSTSDSERSSSEPQEPSKILGLLGQLFGKEEDAQEPNTSSKGSTLRDRLRFLLHGGD
jgi:hypothetical protein